MDAVETAAAALVRAHAARGDGTRAFVLGQLGLGPTVPFTEPATCATLTGNEIPRPAGRPRRVRAPGRDEAEWAAPG